MAINFPDSPNNGDNFVAGDVTYVYNATKSKWTGAGQTPNDRLIDGSSTAKLNGNNLEIGGTPAWSVTGGNYNNLSIRGGDASSSGFIWLGNGVSTNNGDFDLGRVNFSNGGELVSQIKGTTDTSASDDGRISFLTRSTGNSLTERLRVRTNGIQVTGRVFINGTNAGFDYNSVADTLEVLTTNGGTHSEFNANAFVPQGTKNLGASNLRWNTLYIANGIDFGAAPDTATGETVASSLLDDYEEGTFTPTVSIEQVGQVTTDKQYGRYIKVGKKVTVWCYVQLNGNPSGASSTRAWQHGGLPFTMRDVAGGYDTGGVLLYWTIASTAPLSGTAPYHLVARLFNNATGGRIRGTDSSDNQNGQNLSLLLQDNTEYAYSFTYECA